MYGEFSNVYDRLMDDVDYDAWFAYYMALFARAGITAPRRAADICCGTGQFAVRLAERGIQTTGVDFSTDMLAAAQQNARARGVRANFIRMDAARLALHRPVDIMLCACDGVNYLSTPAAAQAFFVRAYEHLVPGGALAFDVSTPYKLEHVLGGRAFGEDRGDVCYLWQNDYHEQSRLCRMELTIFTREADGRYAKSTEHHLQRAHDAQELTLWLSKAGFTGIELFSGQSLEPPAPKDERIHIIARKQENHL